MLVRPHPVQAPRRTLHKALALLHIVGLSILSLGIGAWWGALAGPGPADPTAVLGALLAASGWSLTQFGTALGWWALRAPSPPWRRAIVLTAGLLGPCWWVLEGRHPQARRWPKPPAHLGTRYRTGDAAVWSAPTMLILPGTASGDEGPRKQNARPC